ncbi:MAG TPA: hypothetical protein VMV50_01675 [Candidatus Paceibacterota bacterium]|nr:hypothetical protein [Candidatus Paceibacterota bacterium]
MATMRTPNGLRSFIRGAIVALSIPLGFLSVFFYGTTKLWTPGKMNQNLSRSIFSPDIAHADVAAPASTGGGCSSCCGTCSCSDGDCSGGGGGGGGGGGACC